MRINDLENCTGLERASIRFYEREGLINPKRSENRYRDYSEGDVEQILKIKLLRQLGMSIEKIKLLQRGCGDFSKAMEEQAGILSRQIDENRRARIVCQEISNDAADYQSMDAERYLKMMRELSADKNISKMSDFQENVPKEIHPIRRFVAKMVDLHLFGALVELLLYVVLRIRPLPSDILRLLIPYGVLLLFLPAEALALHLWGTTPGKWVMGIRVESAEGGKLPWFHALCRGWEVMRYGMGFNLPVWSWYCGLKSYCMFTGRSWRPFLKYDEMNGPMDMEWDRDTEISYTNWAGKGKALLAGMLAIMLALDCFVFADCIRPRYRGEVTVAEFAANYNTFVRFMDQNALESRKLQPDGTWQENPNVKYIMDLTGVPEDVNASFHYETENGYVKKIEYQNRWTDILLISPLTDKCRNAAITAASAQDWFNWITFYEFLNRYEYEINRPQGQFRYENIEVIWSMELTNCELTQNEYVMILDDSEPSSINLRFEIIVHEA